ncbi:hypothetical protein LCGC14_1883590 [marine sediment metagenome]|uniref:Lipoprotein n=1 Tax=marine sediment metagenome TaxID=412755 RepID=A0A0F9GPV9_9ZZZZ
MKKLFVMLTVLAFFFFVGLIGCSNPVVDESIDPCRYYDRHNNCIDTLPGDTLLIR